MPRYSVRELGERSLRDAFAAFPTGVAAICALDANGTPAGMTASTFTAVSIDPPLVLICPARTSNTWPTLRARPRLGISVLADGHGAIARALAAKDPHSRFGAVKWQPSDEGAVFIDGAALWIECTVTDEFSAGDHNVAILRIIELETRPGVPPLVFHGSSFKTISPRTG